MRVSFFLTAYTLVLLSEFLDSEALYTISALASRFSPLPVLGGSAVAFAGKMAAAVLLGGFVAKFPATLINAVSAVTFFTMAVAVWFKKSEVASIPKRESSGRWMQVTILSFTSIFCSEWGDLEQITAAALAANSQALFTVWLAATCALMTKGVLAVTLGVGLKRKMPQAVLRYGGVGLFVILGMASALRFVKRIT
jgi:putative Ca2+/H+ antiporter (TMEM165/GDT1 family)